MKGVILDRDSLGSDMDLSPITGTLDHWDIYPSTKKSDIIERCQDASVILSNKVFLGRETMLACPQLKFISILATGTNNVDINAAKDLGITVSNARNYSTESVVQHTLQLMLALVSNINDYQLAARDGRWSGSPFFCYLNRPIQSIHNLTLGIIGFGSQGKRLKTIAEALRVCTHIKPFFSCYFIQACEIQFKKFPYKQVTFAGNHFSSMMSIMLFFCN